MAKLRVAQYDLFPHHLSLHYKLDSYPFLTQIYYPTIDLTRIAAPRESLHRLFCHIALFEGMKFCAAFPDVYDVSAIADGLSENALKAFAEWVPPSWSQHLYENQRSDYVGPRLLTDLPLGKSQPFTLQHPNEILLFGNGGGKDSLLGMKMLGDGGIPYATYQWARSEYGTLREQHRLMTRIEKHIHPAAKERISIHDDFTDATFLNIYYPDIKGDSANGNPCQVGMPEGLFEALPICLAKGYSSLVFANERSASTGNFAEGEVNHQWIKSFAAETAYRNFIKNELISNVSFYSLLRPLYDWQIFQRLSRYPEVLPDIHSCNIQKPWCKRCAKCAYVWMNLMARFPKPMIDQLFLENLFDVPELQPFFRQMMGLETHNAFECIGEINETLLALKKCSDKGLQGKALQTFRSEILAKRPIDWEKLEKHYLTPNLSKHHIPPKVLSALNY